MEKFVMSQGTCADMRELTASTLHTFIVEMLPQLYPAPFDGQSLEVTLGGIADAVKRLEQEAGRPLTATLATILLDDKV